jgi:hypothetical protein
VFKNVTVINIFDDLPSPVVALAAVSNPTGQSASYNLQLISDSGELGKALYDEAEVSITLDNSTYTSWNNGGRLSNNLQESGQINKLLVTGEDAQIQNLNLASNQTGTISLGFNFLTKELTNKTNYTYHLIQRNAVTNEIVGGMTFEIRKQERDSFDADAGNDEEIDRNETITISAPVIGEPATYNWYDPEGNLIFTGTDLVISPEITQTYKLEVISDIDGFKDYDDVQITVNPYEIESLVPNPSASDVTVNYRIDGASSAYLMFVNTMSGNSDNFILDVVQSSSTIDVSSYATGLYNIILICDGEVQNSKTLVKQ